MRLELTGRHLTITTGMRRLVQKHLAHIERLFATSALSAQIVITREKTMHHVEVNMHARGEHFLHGEATAADWQRALTAATDKIERQAQKLNGKWKAKRRAAGARETAPAPAAIDGAEAR